MKNLLSSKEKRQLELMEFLVTSHEWIHLKNLAEKFLCTERILKQDLAELREIFPQVAIHSSTNGIKAHFSKEMSIEDIYRYFFINSQNFSLLEYIFFHEGENISEVSTAFYTTSANLYRIVSKIVKEINPHYQISIQLTPVTVIGNEIDVRYFYAQYFSERYYFLDWPFFDIDEDILIEFANYFYKPTNYPMRFATYRMYKYMIAIGIYRVKGKHFALLPNNFMEKIYPIYEQLPDFKEKITYFSEKLHIDLTPENLAQIFISFKKVFF
nr:M protein trans-acting positive regulator PRD domain-containing protein [uncultured Granulicatella sp.]